MNTANREARYETQRNYLVLEKSDIISNQVSFNDNLDTLYFATNRPTLALITSWGFLVKALRMARKIVMKLLVDPRRSGRVTLNRQANLFLGIEELVFVLSTGATEREKVIAPGNIHIEGKLSGSRDVLYKQVLSEKLENVIENFKEFENPDYGKNIPILKVMVMARG